MRARFGRAADSLWTIAGVVTGVALMLAVGSFSASAQGGPPNVRPPGIDTVPGGPAVVRPERWGPSDIEIWRKVREGVRGKVSIPDKKAALLVQSDGEAWRNFRNGPLPRYGAWGLGAVIIVLAAFFLVRGRIAIEGGWAGRTITRFGDLERFGHWLLATSFVILALTGLNILYGRYVLLPVIGKEAFATLSQSGKWLHNYVAFAFMVGLVLTFIVWVRHNFPTFRDLVWLAKGGGLLVKGSHPAAWKFNAGQKILFWLVMLGGLSISLSGISLMFPFETAMFAKTFAVINVFGFDLPTNLTPLQEMQYASSWHAIVGLVLVGIIVAHIYIGTLGMQGAFSAMGTGQVDVNWAKEHHSLWADEELKKTENEATQAGSSGMVPAE